MNARFPSREEAETSARRLLDGACDPATTELDYIIVGSGAGGGPLAARLAEGGKRVLVLEAGADPATDGPGDRETYHVPGYHGAATEDPDLSWDFSVRHYDDDSLQARDSKYEKSQDPSKNGGTGKGGIFYPRASGIGGCTSHYAMIVLKPNDYDWDRIAALTGDTSWRSDAMQGYFARIENCDYYKVYQGFFRRLIWIYEGLRNIVQYLNPRWQLDRGGHGRTGWLKTNFIDPVLIVTIAWGDRTFIRVLWDVARFLLRQKGKLTSLAGALVRLQLIRFLDPNFGDQRKDLDAQPAFIPIGVDGKRRRGIRERLVTIQQRDPEHLVLLTEAFATRIVFRKNDASGIPRAVGVEVSRGPYLYEASPKHAPAAVPRVTQYFTKGEVIVAGGAFNSPQLLMLSGIGDAAHLGSLKIAGPRDASGAPVSKVIDLPGVGRNLQDRYEVSVVSRTTAPFTTLNGVSFTPGDPNDPARLRWHKDGDGLYATNGGALSFFHVADTPGVPQIELPHPDVFVFGAPAAFRGYYWGWSRELLRRIKGAPADERDLWSWLILKAYTNNNAGSVRLRSVSPFQQPEINFRSFREGPDHTRDVAALAETVAFVRRLNSNVRAFQEEIQPGPQRPDGSTALNEWIQDEAWGHHACGTCRMGSDVWQPDVAELRDEHAVLDSKFRVHGVRGLRVVDASIFPEIPGYFIVTPTFMIGEKAADILLAKSQAYPEPLEAAEARAVLRRRDRVAGRGERDPAVRARPVPARLPADTVGLALSGGGIRSATYGLGILQALARHRRLSGVDILSTVSGGGFIGAFLGRLFTRIGPKVADPAGRVEKTLADTNADEIWWLRSHADYLGSDGLADFKTNLGVVWRNLLAVHLCVGALIVAIFALLRLISPPSGTLELALEARLPGFDVSPWVWLPIAILVTAAIPAGFAFWLAPRSGSTGNHPLFALLTWLLLLAAAIAAIRLPGPPILLALGILALLLAWVWQDAASWRLPKEADDLTRGSVVRNRLTRGFGATLIAFLVSVGFVVLDSFARVAAQNHLAVRVAGTMSVVLALLPLLRSFSRKFFGAVPSSRVALSFRRGLIMGLIAFPFATLLLFGLDLVAHAAFRTGSGVGWWLLIVASGVAVILGRATHFLNLSSLQAMYGSRIARTFLGASNPARLNRQEAIVSADVTVAHPDDDVPFHSYHPERNGGPLHLINVCLNDTVESRTGRRLEQDRGLPMCVGPAGVSVGVRFHATWERRRREFEGMEAQAIRMMENRGGLRSAERTALRHVPVAADPDAFHVLAHVDQPAIPVEPLRLSQWISISGASFTTGSGRRSSVPLSLLLGLLNVRLGYWWDTGVSAGKRPQRYPPSLLRRIKSLPGGIFRTQQTILNEWRAYFPGPSERMWYLSDGGHFENLGLYELIRRRVPFMIAIDAEQDGDYGFESMALLVRQTRIDFGADITWIEPVANAAGWQRWANSLGQIRVPGWIQEWINPDALGPLDAIRREGGQPAALAEIRYPGEAGATSWLLVVRACLPEGKLPLDLESYAAKNPTFPNQSTLDQSLDDDQWESYRLLGELTGRLVFPAP